IFSVFSRPPPHLLPVATRDFELAQASRLIDKYGLIDMANSSDLYRPRRGQFEPEMSNSFSNAPHSNETCLHPTVDFSVLSEAPRPRLPESSFSVRTTLCPMSRRAIQVDLEQSCGQYSADSVYHSARPLTHYF